MYNFLFQNDKMFINVLSYVSLCVAKCFNTSDAYYSVKFGSISFLSFLTSKKFHHLLACHTIGMKPSFYPMFLIYIFLHQNKTIKFC